MNTPIKSKAVAITGHRADSFTNEVWVRKTIREVLGDIPASHVIQGMANGVDLWSAAEAWHLGLPFTAVKPWATHSAGQKWNAAYEWAEKNAEKIQVISPATTYPGVQIYQTRNIWMVDHADVVLAVWDGRNKGGTYACIQYALKEGKAIYRINPVKELVQVIAARND